jgi:hypothetical protein
MTEYPRLPEENVAVSPLICARLGLAVLAACWKLTPPGSSSNRTACGPA